jgi:hypothetical protein
MRRALRFLQTRQKKFPVVKFALTSHSHCKRSCIAKGFRRLGSPMRVSGTCARKEGLRTLTSPRREASLFKLGRNFRVPAILFGEFFTLVASPPDIAITRSMPGIVPAKRDGYRLPNREARVSPRRPAAAIPKAAENDLRRSPIGSLDPAPDISLAGSGERPPKGHAKSVASGCCKGGDGPPFGPLRPGISSRRQHRSADEKQHGYARQQPDQTVSG